MQQEFHNYCYICPHKCRRKVIVEDGKIVKLDLDLENSLSTTWCPVTKGQCSPEIYHHTDRLKYPQKRVGARGEGKWQRISWDEALDTMANKLRDIREKYGPEYVALCLGEPKNLEIHFAYRFATMFGTPNVATPGNACDHIQPGGVYTFGWTPRPDNVGKPRLMVLWGNDLLNTHLGGMSREAFRDALLNGAKLAVIDVKKIDIAKRADMWIRPRPSSDGALAMGIIKFMIEEKLYDEDFVANWTVGFDKLRDHVKTFTLDDVERRTWVPQQQIREFARLYSEFQPASILPANGLHRAGTWFQCSRAFNIIRALSGNVNCPGADILYRRPEIMSPGRLVFPRDVPARREMSKVLGSEYKLAIRDNFISREVLIKTILEEKPYPIKAVLFILTNPLVSYTNTEEVYKAFMKLDFIAGSELFPTPTTAIADIVLPAAWGVEMETMSFFGGGGPKIIDPPGEAWPDTKWINELGKRIGLPGWWDDDKEVLDLLLQPTGITWEEYKQKGAPDVIEGEGEYKKPEEGIFTTPSGKAEIYSEQLKELGYSPMPTWEEVSHLRFELSEEYPLLLTNPKEAVFYLTGYKHISGLRRKKPLPVVEIHPETAKKAGLKEGEWVYIETKKGKIKQILSLNPDLDPRVISAAFGWWFPEEPEDLYQFRKSNINMLTDSDPPYGPELSTPELGDILCRVSKVEDKEHRKDYMARDEHLR